MFTNEFVMNVIGKLKDPILDKTLLEINAIQEVKMKEEKKHISLKIGLSKTGTAEQMKLQQEIVALLKKEGAETVGLRFVELSSEELAKYGVKQEKAVNSLLSDNNKTTFIAIASGKGGVGKSTVSANFAVAMARLGKKVGIIDADIYGFSIPDMMGIKTRPVVRDNKIIPVERFGVKVMSMGFFVEDNAPIIWRGPMLGKMLNSFFSEVVWGDLDYLILDLPPGTGDVALDVHSMLPSCKEIIVTTPHPTAAFVAARAGAMALQTDHSILGVIENMSYFESKVTGEREYVFGQGGGEKLAEELSTDILGSIPLEQPEWDTNDFAPSIYKENHKIGKLYLDIASKIDRLHTTKEPV